MHRAQSRIPVARRAAGVLLALGLAAMVTGGNSFRAAPPGQSKAFLIVKSDLGFHYGKFEEDCPDGFEMTVEERFLSTKTPAEKERLLRPENAREYAQGWKDDFITGPGGENVCNNPAAFMNDPRHGLHRGVASKVAYGMNLDGTPEGGAVAGTCKHQKFVGVNGEAGIDNQLYRVMGCHKVWRSTGAPASASVDPFLVEIRGLDDPRNDDHVEVGLYSTDDTPLQGSDGAVVANQTLGITANAKWRTTVAGRIVDGQLTTDVIDALYLRQVLPTWGLFGQVYSFEFHRARLRMSLAPDGTLVGLMGSYRPIDNIFTVERCCKGSASTANNDCASVHKTLAHWADGFPDPETGLCTMVSSAVNMKGIPVFISSSRTDVSRK